MNHRQCQQKLVFPEDHSDQERAKIEQHLEVCAECQRTATATRKATTALALMQPVKTPEPLRRSIRSAITKPVPGQMGVSGRRKRTFAVMFLASFAALFGAFGVLNQQTASLSPAYAMLQRVVTVGFAPFSYSGTATVTYTRIPWYLLPPRVADYAGRYRIQTRWSVRDAWHFRVDIRVIRPIFDEGHIVGILNGSRLTLYDARSGRSTVIRGHPLRQLGMTPSSFLAFLQNGAQPDQLYSSNSQSAMGSVHAYLTSLLSTRADPGIHPFARIVRQTRILGHPVDVIEFGPLSVMSYDSSGCHPTTIGGAYGTSGVYPSTSPCHHYRQSIGWARVWVATDRPVILRFEEHGLSHVHNVLDQAIRFQYAVSSIHFGSASYASKFSYQVPGTPTVTHVGPGQPAAAETEQGASDVTPPGFIDARDPSAKQLQRFTRLATTFLNVTPSPVLRSGPSALPFIPGLDVLFGNVRHWFKIYTIWHGQASIYVTGPYIFVQERKLTRGLPLAFMHGIPVTAGHCAAWSGKYWDGQRYIALQLRSVSVVISSNTLAVPELLQYAANDVCP